MAQETKEKGASLMQPETKFKMEAMGDLESLRRHGGKLWVVKTQQVAIRGTPDLILGVSGLFIAIELKKDQRCKPTRLQAHNLSKIEKAGCLSFVACPENWPEIFAFIRDLALRTEARKP
jgi:hypothetical protein